MNKLFVLIINILLITNVFTFRVLAQKNEPFTIYTFSDDIMSSVNMVEVNTLNSSLTLNGDSNAGAVVEMFVSGNSSESRRRKWSEDEIKKYLEENHTIEVKVDGEKLLITVKQKNKGADLFSISFKITVPKQMNTHLITVNGSITLDNLSGSQKFQTVNGSLTVNNISGTISGKTVNGSITVTNSKDDINLSTINGSITATNCDGKVNLSTVNGKVKRK